MKIELLIVPLRFLFLQYLQGMSESSKKEKSLCSPGGGRTSPNVSQDEEKATKCEDKVDGESLGGAFSATREVEGIGDDSSYSSFYSFLKTDKSDASMKSSPDIITLNTISKTEVNTSLIIQSLLSLILKGCNSSTPP
jgi:hypothetical protein